MIQVINRLSQAKRISIYGTGISYTIASQAAFKSHDFRKRVRCT